MDLPADPLSTHPETGRIDERAGQRSSRTHLALVSNDSPGHSGELEAQQDSAALLPRIAAGDELAVRECIARYGPLIWALVRRWSPELSDAEDAVQEVFVDLWRSAARYDAMRASEAGFVAMVTRRRLIDRLRRRQRAMEFEPLPDDFDIAHDTGIDLDRELRVERARAALRALPTAQRTMLELALLHGRTHDEIARETNTPLGRVKSHIRRGLLRAQSLLAEPTSQSDASRTQDTGI